MNPLDVLKPNYLPETLKNRGVEDLVRNKGLGVAEVAQTNPQAVMQQEESVSPSPQKEKLRIAKARELGRPKELVGF